jgi:hypothetical protein
LLFTGQKAIGAAWLLWLVAVVVLLLNAAYRDGTVVFVGNVFPQIMSPAKRDWDLVLELAKGDFSTTPPKWSELEIGGRKFTVSSSR